MKTNIEKLKKVSKEEIPEVSPKALVEKIKKPRKGREKPIFSVPENIPMEAAFTEDVDNAGLKELIGTGPTSYEEITESIQDLEKQGVITPVQEKMIPHSPIETHQETLPPTQQGGLLNRIKNFFSDVVEEKDRIHKEWGKRSRS